jgi:hypothetical protein
MRCRSRWSHCRACMFGFLMLAIAGCSRKLTPEEFGRWYEEVDAVRSRVSHYKCSAGERGWDYVCVVSWEPKPSARPYISEPQRWGYKINSYYRGKPVCYMLSMPVEGPVLSEVEAKAWLRNNAPQ